MAIAKESMVNHREMMKNRDHQGFREFMMGNGWFAIVKNGMVMVDG